VSDRQQSPGLTADGPPRAVLIAAVAVATAAIAVVIVLAVLSRHPQTKPVVIPPVPAPQADDPACKSLISALPQRLGDYQRVSPADPVPAGVAAWQSGASGQVVLRCGLDRPSDFVVGAPIQVVDTVQWFEASDAAGPTTSGTAGIATWFAVDRPIYVALTLPQGSGPTPIQQLSDLIAHQLAAVPIRPGPAP
jgi:Protein of unknown function (DUF3515)